MLVSIIVPVYNVEDYLESCVKSLVCQSFDKIEIILIDDGSTDNSGILCDELKKQDQRITVIHQSNKGLSGARNTGIEIAKGDYISFVDSDDMISPFMISNLTRGVLEKKCDISVCRYKRCDADKTFCEKEFKNGEVELKLFSRYQAMEGLVKTKELPVTAWGKLYNRRLFENIRFPEGKYNEDVFTTYKLYHLANKLCLIDRCDYIYRINSKSIMCADFSFKRFDGIEGKLLQLNFIKKKYPDLAVYAESSIIAVCNECVFDMGRAKYKNSEKEKYISSLYHKYLRSYLKDKTSLKGKIFGIVSFVSVDIGKKLAYIMRKAKPIR